MMSILQEKKNWRGNLLGVLPTFYDEQTRESKATMESLQERFQTSLLPPIHRSTLLRECASQGQTIFEMDPLCRAAKEYLALTRLILKY
jgi:chromosome partitioning protein